MKKIFSLLMAVMLVLTVFTASAASALKLNPADVDFSADAVTITGSGLSAGEKVVVLVTNPGKTNADKNDETAVQNIREVAADENGEFSYKFVLNGSAAGYYNIYVGGNGNADWKFYYDKASAKTIVENLISYAKADDLTNFSSELNKDGTLLALSINDFEPIVSSEIALGKTKLATSVMNAVKTADKAGQLSGTDNEKIVAVQKIIKSVAALELLNQSKDASYSFNTDGTFKYESALLVSGVDAKYGVTLYDYYINGVTSGDRTYVLTSEGKAQVQNSLMNKNFVTEEDLYEEFIKAVVCTSVNNSTLKGSSSYVGSSHVNLVLTSANKTATGVSSTTITSYIASGLAGQDSAIATIDALNALIASFAQAEPEAGSGSGLTGGPVGGGGAPSVTPGGTAVIPPVVENQNALNQNDQNHANTYKYKFDDIADVQWAVEAIEYLYTKGVVNGKADRVYDPNGTVTREEIVKMISIAVGLTEEAEIAFADVDSASWAKPFIAKAVKAGIISGISETEFGFGQNVTRQDIATMLYRVIGVQEVVNFGNFADGSAIADYAKEAVGVLADKKIINGFEDNTFRPFDSCTRAQAAVIIYNYLKTSGLAN